MRAFFVVAALAIAALASSVDLDFEGGANLTNAGADFSFRFTHTSTVTIPAFVNFLGWSSISVDASTASEEAQAQADAMIGVGLLPTTKIPPVGLLAYGSGKAAIKVNFKDFLNNLISLNPTLDANFEGSVVAMAALDMREVDPEGNFVGLPIVLTAPGALSCIGDEISGEDDVLTGYTCNFKKNSAKFTITYVTSQVAGILEYGNTPVSPRTFEMIIEVDDFPLSDPKNHVRMDIALITASGAGSVEGSANVVHREGKEDLYIAASKHAVVDGKRTEINVTVKSGATDFDNTVNAILNVALGSNFDAQIAHVDFPAGATSFVYDPAVGSGKDIYECGASTVALSVLVALVCVLFYLF